jgi:hypothetical protein
VIRAKTFPNDRSSFLCDVMNPNCDVASLEDIIYALRELELLKVIAQAAEGDSGSVFPGARYVDGCSIVVVLVF